MAITASNTGCITLFPECITVPRPGPTVCKPFENQGTDYIGAPRFDSSLQDPTPWLECESVRLRQHQGGSIVTWICFSGINADGKPPTAERRA